MDAQGNDEIRQRIGVTLPEKDAGAVQSVIYEIGDDRLYLAGYVYLSELFRQIGLSMIAVLGSILILIFFTVAMIRQIHRQIIVPIGDMQKNMEQMRREEDAFLQIDEDYPNLEFSLLKDSFNSLMNVIVGLKIKLRETACPAGNRAESGEAPDSSALFLNALTTISSLSLQGRCVEIVTKISALSKNIRYIFRSGLDTGAVDLPGTSVRMVMAVIGILPVVAVYPLMQKFLIEGVVVSAVKG